MKDRKCPNCNIICNGSTHIYSCSQRLTNDKNELKYNYIKYNFPKISLYENLYEAYVLNLMSLPDIKNTYDIDYKSILFLLNYFNIKKRSLSESSKKISVEKYKKTCMIKYGYDNVSKSENIKEKKANTFLVNYGVDNIFKDNNFKKWILENNFAWNNLTDDEIINRIKKQTLSIKKFWNNLTDEKRIEYLNIVLPPNRGINVSSLESKIAMLLTKLHIPFETQYVISNKRYDFLISNTKILIEVNGDYWHCNPIFYKEDDIINMPSGKIKVSEIWNKDIKKRKIAEDMGFKVVYIWENEFNSSDEIMISLIIERIGI